MTDDANEATYMDVMDAYRVARNGGFEKLSSLKAELAAMGWSAERINDACKKLAEMLLKNAEQ